MLERGSAVPPISAEQCAVPRDGNGVRKPVEERGLTMASDRRDGSGGLTSERLRAYPIFDRDGKVARVIEVVQDVPIHETPSSVEQETSLQKVKEEEVFPAFFRNDWRKQKG
ncbi:MAG: hypothetical protein MPW15_24220 [Candidatus Manganitrophus sp.]|nr:hypothetical protein [Candidatus Manganitrophus sp.]